MQTRSQTTSSANNLITMIDKINDDVLRKTKLLKNAEKVFDFCSIGGILNKTNECESVAKLRTPSTINKNPRLPTQPFTIRTRASTRAAELQHLQEFRSTLTKKKPKYHVEIDFDEAIREWNKNKIRLGNGVYKYIEPQQ